MLLSKVGLSLSCAALISFIWLDACGKLAETVQKGNLNNISSGRSNRLMSIPCHDSRPFPSSMLVEDLTSLLLQTQPHPKWQQCPSKHCSFGTLNCNEHMIFALMFLESLAPHCNQRFPNAYIDWVIDIQFQHEDSRKVWLCWLSFFCLRYDLISCIDPIVTIKSSLLPLWRIIAINHSRWLSKYRGVSYYLVNNKRRLV